jgi:hypothetical protein
VSDAIPFAIGVALSPIPIAAALLILGGQRARLNGPLFAAGWTIGVATTVVLCFSVVHASNVTDDQPTWLAIAQLAFGAAFLLLALHLATSPRRRAGLMPNWLSKLDAYSPNRAAGLGVVLACANPKNIALTLGGTLALAQAELWGADALPALLIFVAIGAAGVLLPLLAYTTSPTRSGPALEWVRNVVIRHDRTILIVVGLVIGAKFLLDGTRAL